ncbi:baseplate J/gp47 family protein [Solitalea sp. MAHUQ-68]|uniref:Baseplate J/gp47 family protein n=1 Tax=Solitalea agri TaxID=2953739 RepID=A0A9X2JDS4_9SPHI|nr:baseplate J/gp47 family protein [Solitalea agri]MCO4294458.1 baseplate J/gp47 family protein [Solitalea agri]
MACNEKNPLEREGTSILNRMLSALATSFVKPDEREAADMVLFMRRYSAYLNYYNSSNVLDGDWEPLMKMDISVTLAVLMRLDAHKCSDYKKLVYKKIRISGTDTEAQKQFTYIFDLSFSLLKIVAEQYHLLPETSEFKQEIETIIKSKVLLPAVNLKKLFDDFKTNDLINNTLITDSESPINTIQSNSFNLSDLGAEWTLPTAIQGLTIPASLTVPRSKIIYIINHNFFNAQVEALLKAISTLAEKAHILFDTTLDNFPSHTPHYALVLSFIKLFGFAQNELNKYTQHHLDFYYKDVLQLTNKKAIADSAHLLMELQKPVPKYLLTAGTLFRGGKDKTTGKELSYALSQDVVLNKAKVEKLQSIQITNDTKEILAASSIANSEDGQGAKLTSIDNSWFTFGDPEKISPAVTGFAIATNLLFLNEGTRTITITVNFVAGTNSFVGASTLPIGGLFTGKLSGLKDWHNTDAQVQANSAGNTLTFLLTLSPDDPAIIPYTESIHKENIETDLPVLKIYLNQSSAFSFPYRLLTNDQISSIKVEVEVNGVRNLELSSETGTIDAAKPFKPYGEFPVSGASFYIGSKEIFQKSINELRFEFGETIPYSGEIEYLRQGKWIDIRGNSLGTDTYTINSNFVAAKKDFTQNEPLTATTLEGFIRLLLASNEYSKSTYLSNVKAQIDNTTISQSTTSATTYEITTGEIASPPELTLPSFSISYKAFASIPLSSVNTNSNHHFLHLTPFGYYEAAFDPLSPSKKISLVTEMPNDGELYVGLNNTEPEEVVNLLLQVADGSSNPLKNEETITWYYLSKGNLWKEFESKYIIDRTHNLTQSGIVTVTLPIDISNENTALQKGLYWLKVTVKQNPDAVCKLILVQAQAALVQLVQNETKQIEFSQILPAGTISKPVTGISEIKNITQPFDSFGGRTRETDEHFYTRVSERLRHKQRGITIWDYEHIVLEAFPQISKVKCINHAGFYTAGDGSEVFCENYPGHVSVITIPDFRNKSGINPLRPYTPIGTIINIDEYLHKLISPFVKLHVKNPQFEEVQFEFSVTFHEHLDEGFYRQMLEKEIERNLTPWAFDSTKEVTFGGKIIKSAVLNFIEERAYVDFVTCFKMHHIITRNGATHITEKRDVEVAVPSTARSLLVSYYNEITKIKHLINSPATCEC